VSTEWISCCDLAKCMCQHVTTQRERTVTGGKQYLSSFTTILGRDTLRVTSVLDAHAAKKGAGGRQTSTSYAPTAAICIAHLSNLCSDDLQSKSECLLYCRGKD